MRPTSATPAPDSAHDSDEETWSKPSKSQLKRDMTALQKLGEELVELSPERLDRLTLPDNLRDAVEQARRIAAHEGKRRQLQYIGRLMRAVDAAPIRAALDAWKGASRAETAALHLLEQWRERLLDDDAALIALTTRYTAALNPMTLQQLRTSIRMARKERKDNKPPRHYRELFQLLKSILEEKADGHDDDAA